MSPAPAVPVDLIERLKIAVVAVLAANADIQTIADRASGIVSAWNADMTTVLPVVAYRVVVAAPGGGALGDTREVLVTFSAIAPTESVANALLNAIEVIVWPTALAAQSPPLDGYMRNPVRRDVPWDTDEDLYRADLELTMTVTK